MMTEYLKAGMVIGLASVRVLALVFLAGVAIGGLFGALALGLQLGLGLFGVM